MSVELKDLEVGSVIVDIAGSVGIVTELRPFNPVRSVVYACKASGSRYIARPADLKAVLGKVDINAFTGACGTPIEKPEYTGTDLEFLMPEPLRSMGLKIGDKIKVRHGSSIVEALFKGYKPSRPRYPISYEINGRPWKGPVSGIIGKAA